MFIVKIKRYDPTTTSHRDLEIQVPGQKRGVTGSTSCIDTALHEANLVIKGMIEEANGIPNRKLKDFVTFRIYMIGEI